MHEELNFDDPKFVAILDKTIELFFEFGIRNLNMDDISRSLGISKKTLYQYVKSKEDLIEKLFYYDEMKWNLEFSKIKADNLNAIEILLKVSLIVYEEMGKLNPKLKFELKKYYEPIYYQFMVRKQNQIFSQMSKNILKGIGEGLYRSDVNVELAAGLYVRNLVDMHNKDYCMIENITFDQVFQVMFENHIRAISSPEGIAYFEKRKAEIIQSNKNIFNQ
ncbi:MAG: TetR/AcrR family transcriptional regulator [Prolixibacteraceae bacterium]|nr:TetR/AcrR family transcriptional regulator [Prolixibacteraceae bacterium]